MGPGDTDGGRFQEAIDDLFNGSEDDEMEEREEDEE